MKITEETLKSIESIFDIQLNQPQKEYILGNTEYFDGVIINGKTFACCLKLLLSDGRKIELSFAKRWYKGFFVKELIEVNSKLVSAGFETRLDMTS